MHLSIFIDDWREFMLYLTLLQKRGFSAVHGKMFLVTIIYKNLNVKSDKGQTIKHVDLAHTKFKRKEGYNV